MQTAQLLRQSLRYDDYLARYGGDEFLILTRINSADSLSKMVERIQKSFEQFNQASGKPYRLTLSIGQAIYDPQLNQTPEQFLAIVDQEMYREKRRQASAIPETDAAG